MFLQKTWTARGRRYVHMPRRPIGSEWSSSGKYVVRKEGSRRTRADSRPRIFHDLDIRALAALSGAPVLRLNPTRSVWSRSVRTPDFCRPSRRRVPSSRDASMLPRRGFPFWETDGGARFHMRCCAQKWTSWPAVCLCVGGAISYEGLAWYSAMQS